MNGRDELLRMMLSRNITPEEFNFDRLDAPPVEYFLSRQDIDDLIYLANSVKYSAKIEFKYKEIDRILKARKEKKTFYEFKYLNYLEEELIE